MTIDWPKTTSDVRFGTFGHTEDNTAQPGTSAADQSTVSGRASRLYLIAGTVAVFCFLVVPPFVDNTIFFVLVGLSATLAIGYGIKLHKPQPALPWLLFIGAQVAFYAGDFFYYSFDLSSPNLADLLYVAYYPLQTAGLLLLIRSRSTGRESTSLLDALIVAVGFGLPSWIYLIAPYLHGSASTELSNLVAMAYPALDVVLLTVTARLVMGSGLKTHAFRLLVLSTLFLIVTDVVYAVIELRGTYVVGAWLDAGWMASYVVWGAAALHPSMRQLSAPATTGSVSLSTQRIFVLAGAVLIGPVAIAVDQRWPIAYFDTRAALIGSAVIFLLALVRMLGLVASLREAIARHQNAERRETILRYSANALTGAPDREFVRLATIEGAVALARDLPDAEVEVDLSEAGSLRRWSAEAHPGVVEVSLATRAAPYGRLTVTSSSPVPTDVVDGLETLGAQSALALESVALTEGLSQQRSEARVGALVQNSSDMILLVDATGMIRYVTPSVANSLGRSVEDLIGTPAYLLGDPADHNLVRDFYLDLARHPGKSVTADWRMQRADGQITEFEAVVCNLLENPSVEGIVVTAHDITERKALEAALKQQVQELEELDRIRSDFVATVSHELRTPLTNIIGEVELLADGDRGELTSCQETAVDAIGRNGDRLLGLIEDLLTLSQVETTELVLHREPTDVVNLIEDVGSQMNQTAAAKAVKLELDYGADSGVILADPHQLDRALLNLLSNAVKFTPAGGTASLRVDRIGDDVEFTVSDNGVGIPEEEQVRLFTRFFRSSVATRLAIQGTGLGLVIVKRIVEAHGGTVSIVSKQDVGTTVTVRLPAGMAAAAEESAEAGAA